MQCTSFFYTTPFLRSKEIYRRPYCRAFLARRRGARPLRRGCGKRGRGGALKTGWTKPWHGGASYGDRMAPAVVERGLERTEARGSVAQAAIMECAPGGAVPLGAIRRVRKVLPIGWAARSCGGLVATSGRSEALGASAGVMKCHGSGSTV